MSQFLILGSEVSYITRCTIRVVCVLDNFTRTIYVWPWPWGRGSSWLFSIFSLTETASSWVLLILRCRDILVIRCMPEARHTEDDTEDKEGALARGFSFLRTELPPLEPLNLLYTDCEVRKVWGISKVHLDASKLIAWLSVWLNVCSGEQEAGKVLDFYSFVSTAMFLIYGKFSKLLLIWLWCLWI